MSAETEREELVEGSAEYTEVVRIRREKLAKLQSEGLDPFREVKYERTHHTTDITSNFEAMENQVVSIAGRIMSKRDMGKASFCDLLDQEGRIQLYVKVDELGTEGYERFKKLDIGDIVGVKGFVFKTRRGEISVHVQELTLLSKSLLPLQGRRYEIQAALCRPDRQSRSPRDIRQALGRHPRDPRLYG